MTEINKILIIRLSALGDTIHTIPMANALRKQYPNAQIDWIVEDKAEKFIVNNPLINNVYVLKKREWKKNPNKIQVFDEFFKIIKSIREQEYDVVIDTQQLLKSAIIMGLSGGKRKLAPDNGREFSFLFANEIIKMGRKQFDINYHVVKRNLEIAQYLGCKDLSIDFIIPDFSDEYSENVKSIIDNINKTRKTIVISPATTWTNKHWTVNGWKDIINEFKNQFNIILTATEKEKSLTQQISDDIKGENIIDLTGQTNLSDMVYVFKNADLVVSPDSGSAHIAWAVNHPAIITLFFATSANRTAPFGNKYFSISAKTSCSPCMKKHCRLKSNKNNCISEIKSQDVINIIKNVLQ
ncbi:glycosyltransferase family 9 protein [bacterium]|nr:glycosyltransferase family 9 protein [bacterium]